MSFIYRDGSVVPRSRYNQAVSTYNKFKSFWPTQMVDGVEVLVPSRVFYRKGFIQDKVTKDFVKALGYSWEDFLLQDVDGEIETMYFKFKNGFVWDGTKAWEDFDTPREVGYTLIKPTRDQIDSNIRSKFKDGEKFTVTISYGGALQRYIKEHSLPFSITDTGIVAEPLNKDDIINVILSNPWYYIVNSRHIPYNKNSYPFQLYDGGDVSIPETFYNNSNRSLPVCDVSSSAEYGILALLSSDYIFSPTLDDDGSLKKISDSILVTDSVDGQVLRYDVTFEFTYNESENINTLSQDISGWFDAMYQDLSDIKYNPVEPDRYKEDRTTSQIDTKPKHIFNDWFIDEREGRGLRIEDNLYLKLYDGSYSTYIKAEALASMKKADFVKFLSQQIDIDYTVEAKEWWEDILLVVIIIVAIVISYFTAGAGTAITWSWVATFAGTLAISLSVGGLIMSEVGGLSAACNVKIIGNFAQIAGYVATVTGIMSVYYGLKETVAKEALKEAGKEVTKEALAKAVEEVTVMDVVKKLISDAIDSVVSVVTDGFSSTTDTVSAVMDVVRATKKVNDYMIDQEKESLQKEYDELQALEEEYAELDKSNIFSDGYVTLALELDRVGSYDALTLMDTEKNIQSRDSFKTPSAIAWAAANGVS